MRVLIAMFLIVLGAVLSWVGNLPIGLEAYTSAPLVIAGGIVLAAGVCVLLLAVAQRGGRSDEPETIHR